MAPSSIVKFIDTSLFSTDLFALSYTDPDQKWLIRKHLISFVDYYPKFTISTGTYNHNDGTMVNLVYLTGYLQACNSTLPSIPLTIWVHENYPHMAPIVFIVSSNTTIHKNHPFIDNDSGATFPPYLQSWEYPRCNLLNLVNKLVKIFERDHPFGYNLPQSAANPNFGSSHPSFVSRNEALDRLMGIVHYDMLALKGKTMEDVEYMSEIQVEMVKRGFEVDAIVGELEIERFRLDEKVRRLTIDADVLINWLKVNDLRSFSEVINGGKTENAFEGVDDESETLLYNVAGDNAIEDLFYALEKAVEEGVCSFDWYIKQVRVLGREQFVYRDKQVKLHKL